MKKSKETMGMSMYVFYCSSVWFGLYQPCLKVATEIVLFSSFIPYSITIIHFILVLNFHSFILFFCLFWILATLNIQWMKLFSLMALFIYGLLDAKLEKNILRHFLSVQLKTLLLFDLLQNLYCCLLLKADAVVSFCFMQNCF